MGLFDLRPPDWPFGAVNRSSAAVIYSDPDWLFKNYSTKGERKNPNQHYQCSSVEEIAAMPVNELAAPDCVLFMWSTFPMLPEALHVMKAWGFEYKSGGAWAKMTTTGTKWQFGTGYVFRSAAELFLVGKRGNPKQRDTKEARSVRNLIGEDDLLCSGCAFGVAAPIREHSRKPDRMYEMIETLFDGPYVELFARNTRPGWQSWGNEVGKFVAITASPLGPEECSGSDPSSP